MADSDTHRLFRSSALRQRFDSAAETFAQADFLFRRCMEGLLERLAPMSLKPEVIVDVGSATGRGSRELARRWRRARVLSIDLSHQMLMSGRTGRGWLSRQRDVQADAHDLPLKTGCADLLVANLSLPWFDQPERCLQQFGRVVRKEGLLLFATLGPDTLREIRDAWQQIDTGAHVHPFADMHDIGDALIRAGLTDPVLDVERVSVTYDDPQALFADLRRSGGTNLLPNRLPGLTGKDRFERFVTALKSQSQDGRIAVTTELVFGHAWARGGRQTPQEFHVEASSIGRLARKT